MQIINHYKSEVDKSIQALHDDNTITDDQMQESSTQHSRVSSIKSPLVQELTNEHLTQPEENPYAVTNKAQIFSKVSKCIVCHKSAKYRCPQCLISYCSSTHFKSHNLFCSEGFFKRQVEQEMKSIKATKKEKEQMTELLKEDKEIKGKENEINKLSEQRLVQLLEMIQQCEKDGKEIDDEILKLTEEQKQRLHLFIQQTQTSQSELKTNSEKSSLQEQKPVLEPFSQPYWLVPDGLDYYFMQEIQIQEFASSAHLDLIIYRQGLAKKYRQEIRTLSQLIKAKPSPLVREDILQYLLIWVLISLGWGSQLKDKEGIHQVFQSLYIKDLAKDIIQKGINQKQAGGYTLANLKQNIAALKQQDTKSLLNSWYEASAISNCKLIVKNKLLLIETFLRLLQYFQSIERQLSSSQKVSKKKLNQVIKHAKKLEFLLSYIKEEINSKQICIQENQTKEDLFRHLYRALTHEENDLLARKEHQKLVKNEISNIKQIQQHGIVIKK